MFNTIRQVAPRVREQVRRVGVVGLAAFAAAALHAAPPQLPTGDFIRRGQFSGPALSPDGKHLVVTQRALKDGRDESMMLVYDLAAMTIVSTVRMPVFEVPASYRWISNTRLAVATGREYGSLEAPQLTGEIVAMDLDGRNQEYLYGHNRWGRSRRGMTSTDDEGFGQVSFVPPSLNGHFLLTEHLYWNPTAQTTRLYDIDSSNGVRNLVTEIGMPKLRFVSQNDGKPRFAYGEDVSGVFVLFRHDDATRQWKALSAPDEASLQPLAISSDNREVYAKAWVNGGPLALVRQSMEGGDRVRLADDKVGSINLIQWGPRPWVPFAAATSLGAPKLRYFDEKRPEAHLHKLLSAQFPGSYVDFLNFSDDGAKLLFSVRSDRDPGVYYLFDRSTGKASLLLAEMPWIDPERMAQRRPIKFKARDGLEIHGYLTLPVERDDAKLPLILLPHGGPHVLGDTWFFDRDAQFLASRGYAVLQVNFRGSMGRGDDFEAAGYRQWGGRIQDDLIDGVRWIVEQGTVDAARICAYGASFGAYSAMMAAIRAPDLFKCSVGYAGLYDLGLWFDDAAVKRDKSVFNYLVKVIGQDPAELERNSPARLADKLTVPVLLVHGGGDRRTLPIQAETMRDALTKARRPPEWMYVKDEGHGFYTEKNRLAFYEKLEAFLARHIGK